MHLTVERTNPLSSVGDDHGINIDLRMIDLLFYVDLDLLVWAEYIFQIIWGRNHLHRKANSRSLIFTFICRI